MTSSSARTRRLLIGVGLLLLVAILVHLGPADVGALLISLGGNFVVVVALFGLHECVRAAALAQCIETDQRPPFHSLIRVRLLGEAAGALTRIGPFAAEPTRALLLAGGALHAANAVGAAASEFIANSTVSAALTAAILAYTLWNHTLHPAVAVLAHVLLWVSAGYVAAAVATLASRTYLFGAVIGGARALPIVGRRLAASRSGVRRMEDAIFRALAERPWPLTRVLALEVVAQAILVFEIYWTIRSMGVAASTGSAMLVSALVKAPHSIQFVGITEGGYALIFNWLGMTAAVGLTLSLVRTLRSLAVSAIGLGLLLPSAARGDIEGPGPPRGA